MKVFSVTELSQDKDGAMGMLVESILEAISQWYSLKLVAEVSKGIQEKHRRGLHVDHASFGYQKNGKDHLIPHAHEQMGISLIFEGHATGNHSYSNIAQLLNERGYLTKRRQAFTKEGVREILRNGIYVGRVSYQKTSYNRNGTRNFMVPVHWEKGQHQPLVAESLWEQCQQAGNLVQVSSMAG